MIALGFAAGVAASVLFNLGIALQAIEARRAPLEEGLRVALLRDLLRRRRWLLGLLLGALGVPLEVYAFANAPFVVIEPVLAAGLIVLLVLGSKLLGERVGTSEIMGVAAIIAGTVLIAWGAPSHSEHHRAAAAVLGVMAGLVLASLIPFALRGTRWDTALTANLGSATGFAATNVAAKLMGDNINLGHYLRAGSWLVVAAGAGVAATITGMTALQRAKATTVVPISTSVQTFLPILLEPLFLSEQLSSAELGGVPLLGGLLLMLAGTVLVARTRAVSSLAAAEVPPDPDLQPPRR